MCDTCGCGDPELVAVDVQEKILAGNDRTAAHNREHFRERGVVAVNLMGSPGSGKTAVLEAMARVLGPSRRLAAITGDLETDRDAQRLRAAGIPCVGVTTGSACHLDAEMVHRAFHHFAGLELDYLFVENVGNLVCPAEVPLGEDARVVLLSVTEGDEKPLKYPLVFKTSDLLVITKTDLLPYVTFDVDRVRRAARAANPAVEIFEVSATTGAGMSALLDRIEALRAAK